MNRFPNITDTSYTFALTANTAVNIPIPAGYQKVEFHPQAAGLNFYVSPNLNASQTGSSITDGEILVNVGGAVTGASATGLLNSTSGLTLGTSVTYGVLGDTTVTNTGSSVITGDLGLYPGTSVTGFPPGTISGTENVNNGAAQAALAAAGSAYTAGQAMVGATVLSASTYDAGGTTIAPGLYKVGSSLAITGTLTLDGGGNSNAIWVFQIGSTFLPQNSSVISLVNGAQAKNVYFLVGSSATIGTSATIVGTIIANISITVTTSAAVTGHLFALTGAVTLDTNAVTATPAGYAGGGPGQMYYGTFQSQGSAQQAIAINGNNAQTYTQLIALLNAQTSGGVWAIVGGNLEWLGTLPGTIAYSDGSSLPLMQSLGGWVSTTLTQGGVSGTAIYNPTNLSLFGTPLLSVNAVANGTLGITFVSNSGCEWR